MKFHLKQQSRAICCFSPGHVAMYLGEGRFVHSTGNTGTKASSSSSLAEEAPDYRADLKESMTAVASIFGAPQ